MELSSTVSTRNRCFWNDDRTNLQSGVLEISQLQIGKWIGDKYSFDQ